MRSRRAGRMLALVMLAAAGIGGPLSAQGSQQGTISGRVTDASTNAPIPAAAVTVVGTTVIAQTNEQGQSSLRGVRSGTVEVRVLRVGYSEQRASVNVTAGGTATLDLQMRSVGITLN